MTNIYKRYVLNNIEKFCDSGSLEQIGQITFWDWECWYDFGIDYFNWGWDDYSYEKNVKPFIENVLT